MPRLSVLLPCRNAGPWLAAAARSLERQSFRDYEVLAIDDGSTDETLEILESWAARDARVRVRSAGRVGLIPALQSAAAAATGDVLGRMDADDIARRSRFAEQLAFLDRRRGIAACGTRVRYFPRSGLRDGARAYELWINSLAEPDELARDIFVECPIAHPTLMVRRDAFEDVGGYRDAGWPEDYDLVIRLWSGGCTLANVPRVLLGWRHLGQRASRVDARYGLDAFRRCKVDWLRRTVASDRPLLIAGAGPTGKAFAREALRQDARLAAFVDVDARKIGQEIHGVEVVRPDRIGEFAGAFGLAAVSGAGPRHEIRSAFARAGWKEMEDFCAIA